MCPDHDHISVCDTGIVEVVGEEVGRLIDLAVSEPPLGGGGRLGLDDTCRIRGSLGGRPEALVDGPGKAGPVEVDGGIRERTHGVCGVAC